MIPLTDRESTVTTVHQDYTTDVQTRPTFLYIGTAKAGSTWIYETLREHPEVFVPKAKDVQFFDTNYDKGIDWYLSLFEAGKGKRAIGELSHNYFLSPRVARRIKQHLPDVRLFCSLREPVDQITSNFLQRKAQSMDKNMAFSEFAFQKDVLKACDYYHNLLPFYEQFSHESIKILFFDELKKDAASFVAKIYRFLEVDPAFVPSVCHQRVLSAHEPRIFWLAHGAYGVGRVLRKLGLVNVVGVVKRSRAFQNLFYRRVEEKPVMPEETAQRLRDYFRERYENLPGLIGQSLPEGWHL
jgi:hypothetical protein